MKQILILVVVFFGPIAFAQKNTTEKIGLIGGNYFVPSGEFETFFKPAVRHLGVKYEYNLHRSFSMGASYCIWQSGRKIGTYFTEVDMFSDVMNGYRENMGPISTWETGDIEYSYNYHLFDLFASCRLPLKKHVFSVAGGPTFCFGKNQLIKSVYKEQGYEDWLVDVENVNASYIGLMGSLGYTYELSPRFDVGISETVRHYPHLSTQYYFNINVDYKFNLLKKLIN